MNPRNNEIHLSQNYFPPYPSAPVAGPMVAPMAGMPPPMLGGMAPQMMGMPPPLLPGAAPFPGGFQDPVFQTMNQILEQQAQENQKLREQLEGNDTALLGEVDAYENNVARQLAELKSKILPGGGYQASGDGEPFPEDLVFLQNGSRSEDLEVEERAILNLAMQEYDHLRLISKLPTNSELYRFKMD